MTTAPLARDQHGNPFELPEEAAYWRVRRQTTGRPRTVVGPDGQPLFIPITAGAAELEDAGCEPASYRLEACDADRQPLVDVPVAVVELAGVSEAIEPGARGGDLVPVSAYLQPSRNANEMMLRMFESMERTRTERERHHAERERWQMQALVEANREMAGLVKTLVRSLRPQPAASDPVTVIEQHIEAKKLLDKVGRRNAGVAPVEAVDDEDVEDEQDAKEKHPLLQVLELEPVQQFAALAATAATHYVTDKMSKGDPEKYMAMNKRVGTIANAAAEATKRVAAMTHGESEPAEGQDLAQLEVVQPTTQPEAPTNLVTQEQFKKTIEEQVAAQARAHQKAMREMVADVRSLRKALHRVRGENTALKQQFGVPPSAEPNGSEAAGEVAQAPTETDARKRRVAEVMARLSPAEGEALRRYAERLSKMELDEIEARLMTVTPEAAVTYLRIAVLPRHAA
jgi:hypothetical protein